jgi:peptidoglycan/LPS O-acetylase OafA/YrhL
MSVSSPDTSEIEKSHTELQSPISRSTKRLTSLDCLRGCAALAVVIHHAMQYGDKRPAGTWFPIVEVILDRGALGVPLFFVISGFCIHLQWATRFSESGQDDRNFSRFWKHRIKRLYPPYFIVLCLSMSLVVSAYLIGLNTPLLTNYPEPRGRWIAIDFFAHAGMLHGLHPVLDKAGGNGPLWTLAREEYFYLLYFVLLSWRRSVGLFTTLGIVFLAGLSLPYIATPLLASDSLWWATINSSAIVLWIQWSLGMLAVEGYLGIIPLPRICRSIFFVLIWASAATWAESNLPSFVPVLWGLTFFTLINCFVAIEKAGRWPNGWVFNWLSGVGLFSYSLYLVHAPMRGVIKQFLGPLKSTADPKLYLLTASVIVVVSFYTAKVFFAVIESKCLPRVTPGSPLRSGRKEQGIERVSVSRDHSTDHQK